MANSKDIRMAIDALRGQLTERSQIWEQRKQDLEVAAYARDECEKLKNPGRVTPPDRPSGGTSSKDEWTLVSEISDPDKKSERRVQGNSEEEWTLALGTYHWSFRQYRSQPGRKEHQALHQRFRVDVQLPETAFAPQTRSDV